MEQFTTPQRSFAPNKLLTCKEAMNKGEMEYFDARQRIEQLWSKQLQQQGESGITRLTPVEGCYLQQQFQLAGWDSLSTLVKVEVYRR